MHAWAVLGPLCFAIHSVHARRLQEPTFKVQAELAIQPSQLPATSDGLDGEEGEPAAGSLQLLASLLATSNEPAAFAPVHPARGQSRIERKRIASRRGTLATVMQQGPSVKTGGKVLTQEDFLELERQEEEMNQALSPMSLMRRKGEMEETEVDNQWFNKKENEELIKSFEPRVKRINDLEDSIEELDDEELRAKTKEFQKRLADGETEEDILEEAFAVVREGAWRALELRHYDVQILGGIALFEGYMAQIGTGEGKTLIATLPVYLNALRGEGAFVVTFNDYLARRDLEQMGQVYQFLGLSVGLIQKDSTTEERKAAYACDVTYVTNSELGFDYLRDHLAIQTNQTVLPRDLYYCLVDEGDSVLIDEARTPLIMSEAVAAPLEKYKKSTKIVAELVSGDKENGDYEVKEKNKQITLTEKGKDRVKQMLGVTNIWDPKDPWFNYVIASLRAKEFFEKEKDYIIRDGEILIIDEFSGRIQEGRRWSSGLHQAMEAKEGVTIKNETEIAASVTYQSLFRLFKRLSSMTGTAITEAQEFAEFYELKIAAIPPALERQRVDLPNAVYKTFGGKAGAVLQETLLLHKTGRPVLVGTTSVVSSERFSAALTNKGIKHEVLNAKPESLEREAEIVAQAGRKGALTISTNMAGRGTDILLGGAPATMAKLRVREDIAAASGIDVPTVTEGFYPVGLDTETEDAIAQAAKAYAAEMRANPDFEEKTMTTKKLELDEHMAIAGSAVDVEESSALDYTRDAFEAVKDIYAANLTDEKEEVMELGGLHVIGTNLHDSRRIDDQLRGRAGRQGDPGSTHFFLSLEDPIFRMFGGDAIKPILDLTRVPEDVPLESPVVGQAVTKTQGEVEDYYLGLRKQLFEIDKVVAVQRSQLYDKRDRMLRDDYATALSELKANMEAVIDLIFTNNWKERVDTAVTEKVHRICKAFFPQAELTPQELEGKSQEEAQELVKERVSKAFDEHCTMLDGVKQGLAAETARYLTLVQTDEQWKGHMQICKLLQESVFQRFQSSGQDPITMYKREAAEYFVEMEQEIRKNSVYSFFMYMYTRPEPA